MFEHVETQHEHQMRMRIFDAANDLLRAYSYQQLKVEDICHVAEISKPTFYRYFADKYALAEWVFTSYERPAMLIIARTHTMEDSLRITCKQMGEHRHFYRKAYATPDASMLIELNARAFIKGGEDILYRLRGLPQSERLDFQIRYTAYLLGTMMARWLAHDMPQPADVFAHHLADACPREFRELFDANAQPW